MSVVRNVNERIERFARKILEKKLYFFARSEYYLNMILNPLLTYDTDSPTKKAKDTSGLMDAFSNYVESYVEGHFSTLQEFSIFYAEHKKHGIKLVVTLSEKEEEAKKRLEKKGYNTEQKSI